MSKIVDLRAEARTYLQKHDMVKLFDYLGAKLAKIKPDDPNAFLLSELEQIIESKSSKEPVVLFTEQDIALMFSMFDLTKKGHVTTEQYLKALNAVGVSEPKLYSMTGGEDLKIKKDTFVSQIYSEMVSSSYGSSI